MVWCDLPVFDQGQNLERYPLLDQHERHDILQSAQMSAFISKASILLSADVADGQGVLLCVGHACGGCQASFAASFTGRAPKPAE